MDSSQRFVITIVNSNLKKKYTIVSDDYTFEESVRNAYTARAKLGHDWKIISVSLKNKPE